MAEEAARADSRLDQPREAGRRLPSLRMDPELFGRASESFARFMGTPRFLIYMTVFVMVWLAWNTFLPQAAQFDPRNLNYTLLTLILSLQASYAAPLILLAQNRQDDRDRVALEQDRARDERNLADTEYLTREVAALRIAMRDVATRDYLRSELRELLDELTATDGDAQTPSRGDRPAKKKKKAKPSPVPGAPAGAAHVLRHGGSGRADEQASTPDPSGVPGSPGPEA